MDCSNVFKLKCAVQTYAWGKPGSQSTVAKLAENDPEFKLDENMTYAEYWMGTHPKGPSIIVDKSNVEQSLDNFIKNHPSVLGKRVLEAFGVRLPFLFKVLSVNKALSIQAHPNKQMAGELYRNNPKNYPDDNHKPEMAIALTEFEGLCGFRPLCEIVTFLELIPELQAVVGQNESSAIVAAFSENKDENVKKECVKKCFTSLMSRDSSVVRQLLSTLADRLSKADKSEKMAPFVAVNELLLRLNSQFPGDVGCFCIYFLNYMVLSPGQSMFLGPNLPHAYLVGDCIECMACSDNTVRAGLTPKYRDVETLCEMLDYSFKSKKDNLFECTSDSSCSYIKTYNPPVQDFAVRKIEVPYGHSSYTITSLDGPSIILVIKGNGHVVNNDSNKNIIVGPGTALFCPAKQSVCLKNSGGELLMFQAYC